MADANTPETAADGPQRKPTPAHVGSAYMTEAGVLELSLRTETDDGTIGEAFLVIGPQDPRYPDMVKHLGGLQPGEGCPIPPFPSKG